MQTESQTYKQTDRQIDRYRKTAMNTDRFNMVLCVGTLAGPSVG